MTTDKAKGYRLGLLWVIVACAGAAAGGEDLPKQDGRILTLLKAYTSSQYSWEIALDGGPGRVEDAERERLSAESALVAALQKRNLAWSKDLFPRRNSPENRKAWEQLAVFIEQEYGLFFVSSFYPRFDVLDEPFSSFLLGKKLKEEQVPVKFGDEAEEIRYLRVGGMEIFPLSEFRFRDGNIAGVALPNSGVVLPNIVYLNEDLVKDSEKFYSMESKKRFDPAESAARLTALFEAGEIPERVAVELEKHLAGCRFSGREPAALAAEFHHATQIRGAIMIRSLRDKGIARRFRYRADKESLVNVNAEVLLGLFGAICLVGRDDLDPYVGLHLYYRLAASRFLYSAIIRDTRLEGYLALYALQASCNARVYSRLACDTPGVMKKLRVSKYASDLALWHRLAYLERDEIRELGKTWGSFLLSKMYIDGVGMSWPHVRQSEFVGLVATQSEEAVKLLCDKELVSTYINQLLGARKFDEAKMWVERADQMVSVDPEVTAHFGRAQIALYMSDGYRDIDKALQAADRVIKQSPVRWTPSQGQ